MTGRDGGSSLRARTSSRSKKLTKMYKKLNFPLEKTSEIGTKFFKIGQYLTILKPFLKYDFLLIPF